MDMNRMTIKLQEALQTASSHAARRSHQGIDIEHLLLAFMEQDGGLASSLLEQAGLSVPSVRQAVEQALAKLPQVQGAGASPGQLHVAPRLSQVLAKAEDEQRTLKDDYLSVEHVVLAMVQEGGVFQRALFVFGFGQDLAEPRRNVELSWACPGTLYLRQLRECLFHRLTNGGYRQSCLLKE